MTTHNEYGAEAYISGCALEAAGAKTKREGIVLRAKGYCEMLATIIKNSPNGERPQGHTLNNKLKEMLERRGKNPPIIGGFSLPDQRERSALEWFHENPKQVAIVDDANKKADALSVQSLQTAYTKLLKAEVKKGLEDGDTPGQIADALKTTVEDVQELIEKAEIAAKKKAEKEQAQPEPTPVPEPTMDIKAVIAGLDMATLAEALAQRPDAKLIADAMFQFAEMQAERKVKREYSFRHLPSPSDLLMEMADRSNVYGVMRGKSESPDDAVLTLTINSDAKEVEFHLSSGKKERYPLRNVSATKVRQEVAERLMHMGLVDAENWDRDVGPSKLKNPPYSIALRVRNT